MMTRFRRDFLALLDARVARIGHLVADRQPDAAQVALLSLQSSSAMVGAAELAALAGQLRSALGEAQQDELVELLLQLDAAAAVARSALESTTG